MAVRSPVPAVSKTLFKVSGEDVAFNQFQDQVLGVVNAFMKKAATQPVVLPVYDLVSRPTASAAANGQIIRMKTPGQPEEVQVCVSTSKGGYEWIVIGLASS